MTDLANSMIHCMDLKEVLVVWEAELTEGPPAPEALLRAQDLREGIAAEKALLQARIRLLHADEQAALLEFAKRQLVARGVDLARTGLDKVQIKA